MCLYIFAEMLNMLHTTFLHSFTLLNVIEIVTSETISVTFGDVCKTVSV